MITKPYLNKKRINSGVEYSSFLRDAHPVCRLLQQPSKILFYFACQFQGQVRESQMFFAPLQRFLDFLLYLPT